MQTPKFTDLLVNPKPYEYVLLPFRSKRFTQIHFEQEEVKNLVLAQDRPKVHYHKKIKYDKNAYVPLEYVNWECNLDELLEKRNGNTKNIEINKDIEDDNTPFKNDLALHLFFEDVFSQKWESFIDKPSHHLILYYQDPNLIFSNIEKKKKKKNKYNLSNDKYYEIKKSKKEDNLDVYGVQHSVPALKLDPIYYKTHLTKEDLRQYCRNYISIRNIRFKFKKTSENKPVFIKKVDDLTVQDNSDVCLIEYCDEYPMFINKEGMVSLINNYIKEGNKETKNIKKRVRIEKQEKKQQSGKNDGINDCKKQENIIDMTKSVEKNVNTDETKNENKNISMADLSEQDIEFMYKSVDKSESKNNENCGNVNNLFNFSIKKRKTVKEDNQLYNFKDIYINSHEPSPLQNVTLKSGQKTTLITNNMFKAPLYSQKIKFYLISYKKTNIENDVCEATIKQVQLLTCGFLFPIIEIYSPHSKSLNLYCKNRLRIAANAMSSKIIKMKDLDDLFPSFSEGSKRKWLKEYTERKKDNMYVLNYKDDEISIIPENVVQYESMLLSERLLKDKIIENEECFWNATRNFLKGNIEVESKDDFYNEKISYQRSVKENLNDLLTKKFYDQESFMNKEVRSTELRESDLKKVKNIEKQDIHDKTKQSYNISDSFKESDVKNKNYKKNTTNVRSILIKRIVNGINEEEVITDEEVINEYMKERKKIKEHVKKSQLKCGRCGAIGHMKTNKSCQFYAEAGKMSKKKKEALKRKMKGIICEIILNVLQSLFSIQLGNVFHKPVNVKKFTNYLQFVSEPIDLGTIKTKARQNKYKKYSDFINDIQLMKDNCVKYNGAEHGFSKVAEEMLDLVIKIGKEKQEEIEEAEKNIEEMETHTNNATQNTENM